MCVCAEDHLDEDEEEEYEVSPRADATDHRTASFGPLSAVCVCVCVCVYPSSQPTIASGLSAQDLEATLLEEKLEEEEGIDDSAEIENEVSAPDGQRREIRDHTHGWTDGRVCVCPLKDPWHVVDLYFHEKGLVYQQTESFNDFMMFKMQVGRCVAAAQQSHRSVQCSAAKPPTLPSSLPPLILQELVDEHPALEIKPQSQYGPSSSTDESVTPPQPSARPWICMACTCVCVCVCVFGPAEV